MVAICIVAYTEIEREIYANKWPVAPCSDEFIKWQATNGTQMLCELMTAVCSQLQIDAANVVGAGGCRRRHHRCRRIEHLQIRRGLVGRVCVCVCVLAFGEAGKIDSRMLIWCSFWIRTSHLVRILESRGHFSFIAHPPSIACRFCRPRNDGARVRFRSFNLFIIIIGRSQRSQIVYS